MIKKDTPQTRKSESIENLLFSGMIYRIISEPEGFRDSAHEMTAFTDAFQSSNIDKKMQNVKDAMGTVDRIKDRGGAFTAFERLLQGSSYNLIIVDDKYQHIFHTEKSDPIIGKLFCNGKTLSLNQKAVIKIKNAKLEKSNASERFVMVPHLIDNCINAYLIKNIDETNQDKDINILLIPNTEHHQFEIQTELIKKYNLTKKERMVLTNLVAGSDLSGIANQFCISVNTVRSHLKSIFKKTQTKSQSALIMLFLNHESQKMETYFEPFKYQGIDNTVVTEDLFIKLSTGNKLCYRDYGVKDGKPLIIFHNIFGSRFHIPYNYVDALLNTNRRIITVERPGYGRSDAFTDYNKHWNSMFNEFIDELGIEKFDLLGNVHSSAHAINYAAECPEKVKSVILSAPLFINSGDQRNLLGEWQASCSRFAAVSKKLAYVTFRLWMKSMKYEASQYITKMIKGYSGSSEIHVLNDQKYIDRIVLNFKESQNNKSDGSAQDIIFSLSPLNCKLEKIKVPFNIWIGDENLLISASSTQQIFSPLPNKKVHVCKGYGEEIFYHLFEEIIQ